MLDAKAAQSVGEWPSALRFSGTTVQHWPWPAEHLTNCLTEQCSRVTLRRAWAMKPGKSMETHNADDSRLSRCGSGRLDRRPGKHVH